MVSFFGIMAAYIGLSFTNRLLATRLFGGIMFVKQLWILTQYVRIRKYMKKYHDYEYQRSKKSMFLLFILMFFVVTQIEMFTIADEEMSDDIRKNNIEITDFFKVYEEVCFNDKFGSMKPLFIFNQFWEYFLI